MGGFPSFWTSAPSSPVRTANFAVHRFESGQDSLASQLRDEKDQRVDADKEIERVLREQNQALEKRIRSLSNQR
jgi:hypothetical protein